MITSSISAIIISNPKLFYLSLDNYQVCPSKEGSVLFSPPGCRTASIRKASHTGRERESVEFNVSV
jgi:hypothetical protein